jgi:hypothetical protein
MSRVARCTLAITVAVLALANCKDGGLAGPTPVVAAVTVIGVPAEGVMLVGGTLDLSASIRDAAGYALSDRAVAWTSSNPAVATVSSHGVVTGVSAGGAKVRGTSEGVSDTATLSVRVAVTPPAPSGTAPMVQAVLGGTVKLSIPPRAVPAGVSQLTVGPAAAAPASTELVGGTAFDFGPSGTQFSTPLTLTLKFDPLNAPIADRSGLAIYHAVGGDYQEVYGSVVNGTTNEVSAPISSFSSYAILRRAAPASVAASAGNNQTASTGTAVPVRPAVRVLDARGRAVRFVPVSFAIASGGGSLTGAAQVSDSDGVATVGAWTLGLFAGANTLTATVNGLAAVTFTAMSLATVPTRLVITAQPVSSTAGTPLAAVVVTARDANNNTATAFSGPVSLALDSNPGGATLGGTATVSAVAGVATFAALTVNRPGTGYTLVASSSAGLTSATTGAFDIAAGAAQRLAFGGYPVAGAIAGTTIDAITVSVRDVAGNLAAAFTGTVTLGLAVKPSGATLLGKATVNAAAGVATFDSVRLVTPGVYSFTASAGGLTGATGPQFDVRVAGPAVGPAAALVLSSGGGQTGPPGTLLPQPIVVQVRDATGHAVAGAGRVVDFAVATGGGSVTPASTTTDASGQASTTWTLGAASGPQSITAMSTGLSALTMTATATGGPVGPASLLVLDSGGGQMAAAGATLAPIIVRVSDAAGNGVAGHVVTFAVTAGGGSVSPLSGISDALGQVATSWTLGATLGAQTMTASASFTPTPLTIDATATLPSLHLYTFYQGVPYDFLAYWPSLSIGSYRLAYFETEDQLQSPLTVTLSHVGTARTSAPASVTIPAGSRTSALFAVAGTSAGNDELIATAPGHSSLSVGTGVDKGVINLWNNGVAPSSLSANDSVQVVVLVLNPVGYPDDDVVVAPTTFVLTPNANIQFVSGGTSSIVITSVTVPAGGVFSETFWVKGVSSGTGSFTITNANYQTFSATLTVTP